MALVITIVVLIILGTVTLNFTIGENGLITKTFEAKYLTELSSYMEELETFKMSKSLDDEEFDASSITAGENSLVYNTQGEASGTIYDVLTTLRGSSFAGKMEIIRGELLLNSTDMTEVRIAQSLGIRVNPYLIVDGVLLSANTNLALMDDSGTLTIPETVTAIGEGAFADLSGLKTIIIPGTVKEIRTNAFRNNADLEKVILQEGVEAIGEKAFQNCSKLTNIELPESLTEIGSFAFSWCSSLQEVTVPLKIEKINSNTFYICTSLTKVELPENLKEIGGAAFSNCSNLEYIYIPSNVSSIESSVFTSCTNLSNIEIASDNEYYKYDNGMLMTTDGSEVVFISDAVLKSINTFNIPEGLTGFSISLSRYTNITTIVIPNSLERIGDADIFPRTINKVLLAEGNEFFTVENECLYNKEKTILRMCFTKNAEAKLADTVTTIYRRAFKQAVNIESITFPDSVTSIQPYAYATGNKKLKTVNIGANVTSLNTNFYGGNYTPTVTIDENNPNYSIEDNVIYNKEKTELIMMLYQINGPYTVRDSVTKIGDSVFANQNTMTSITLPEGLREIGSSFATCNGLTTIYIPNSVETIGSDAFADATNLTQIQIDKEAGSIVGSPWRAIRGDRIVEWLRD